MCCLNVWPSASLQLYIVAHCDKQLHAPGLSQVSHSCIKTVGQQPKIQNEITLQHNKNSAMLGKILVSTQAYSIAFRLWHRVSIKNICS